MAETMRLDKFIANQKSLTRSQVKDLIKHKAVTVNGQPAKSGDLKIYPDKDCINIQGETIIYKKNLYIMLNKPQGVVCSTRDGLSPTVLSLVPEELKRDGLFPAGRLDKDTVGFVLLTDDGDLAHRMLSPRSHVPKRYYCRLESPYEEVYEKRFREGIILEDGTECLPAEITAGDVPDSAFITLHEGMFHQVKRMAEAVGNRVVFLKRVQIGGLPLDEELPLGECRELTPEEVLLLTSDRR